MIRRRRALFKNPSIRYYLLAVGAVVIILLLALWYFNRPVSKKTATIPSTTSVGTPVNNQASGNSQASPSGKPIPSSTSSSASSSQSVSKESLVAPWGNFISNHHPGQNGAPTTESSACNTTPGATCYIKFTNGSQTRFLDTKVADSQGAVIWTWDVKSAGFSAGSWQVSAVASLGGQTKTAADATPLVIE
ncbi:MAG TPA: hypothetical protein VFJ84_03700 [Candidatus Saccharimonadales bacterium]|nr:hypothetical protein [Candidatus Saccharimonadales bacterium]